MQLVVSLPKFVLIVKSFDLHIIFKKKKFFRWLWIFRFWNFVQKIRLSHLFIFNENLRCRHFQGLFHPHWTVHYRLVCLTFLKVLFILIQLRKVILIVIILFGKMVILFDHDVNDSLDILDFQFIFSSF